MAQAKKSKIEPVHIEESEKLKAIFNERNKLSQMQFGEEFEIGSQGMVWQYLNARSPLNVEAALKFSRALGCPVSEFSPRLAGVLSGQEEETIEIPAVIAPDEQAPRPIRRRESNRRPTAAYPRRTGRA